MHEGRGVSEIHDVLELQKSSTAHDIGARPSPPDFGVRDVATSERSLTDTRYPYIVIQ